ncbi:MAG: BspA family leucine-rich repeat surface protein [Bacteroidales bacterium]|nr:BspA family leucine-rich repeat surface protein [Bacteroidales bacterium]
MKKTNILLLLFPLLSIIACSHNSQPVAYAVFEDDTLTFYYNDKKPRGAYDVENLAKDSYGFECKEWEPVLNKIRTVVFDNSFKEYRPKNCRRWFDNFQNLTSVIGIKENLNTSEATDMSSMFYGCENLTSLDVSGFNTGKVTDMNCLFFGCSNLTNLDVSGFNTEKVTDMGGMFLGCKNLSSLDVSGFNTENVTDMEGMFWDCRNLTSLDVSGFNTKNVKSMAGMFYWCGKLKSLNVSGFNTDNDTNMRIMFFGCENLTNLDLSNFNTKNVNEMGGMFSACETLKTIYVGNGWNISNVTNKDMFNYCPNLIGGKGTKYDPSHTDASYAHIDGGKKNPGYFTKKTK